MDFQEFKKKYQQKEVEEYPSKVGHEPIVSVCVQTYQQASYVKECLDGILMQKTSFPFEILLGEDESTDGTRDICIDYAKKYPDKIRLFLHHRVNNIKINGRSTGRFNFLYNLYSARGKYIAMCEGDDYWTNPLKLHKQVSFLENNDDYGLIHTDIDVYFQTKGKLIKAWNKYKKKIVPDGNVYEELLIGVFIKTCTVVFRSGSIAKGVFEMPIYDSWTIGDKPLWLFISLNYKLKYLADPMAVYRVNEESAAQTNSYECKFRLFQQSFEISRYFVDVYGCSNITKSKMEVQYSKKQFLNSLVICDQNHINFFYGVLKNRLTSKELFKYKLLHFASTKRVLSEITSTVLKALKVGKWKY